MCRCEEGTKTLSFVVRWKDLALGLDQRSDEFAPSSSLLTDSSSMPLRRRSASIFPASDGTREARDGDSDASFHPCRV